MKQLSYTKSYSKTFDVSPSQRKHIILIDGTWNDETGSNFDGLVTNIVNLHRILVNDPIHQIVRYHRGVGNNNDNGWISQSWKGATGKTVGGIVERAYARLVQDWQKGDRIYIFGFSRGAAAARMLASKIANEGIPKNIEITYKPIENKESKVIEQSITNVKLDTSVIEHVDIEFLGVWDTVSAFGLTNNLLRFFGIKQSDLFTNNHIASNIKKAVHLVAIDETRNPFVPSLMNHKEGITHEVWFPGVHSDIGGSYPEDSIAKASLYYMIKQMKEWNQDQSLNPFIFNEEALQKYTLEKIEEAYFHFHGKSIGENVRKIGVQVDGKIDPNKTPKIHNAYYQIASSKHTYSVVEINKKTKYIPFQYMPFNIKILDEKYIIVE